MHDAFLQGFGLGLSLILVIGAQNAFVLKQGLKREHVFAVALTCALSDAILIATGVFAFTSASQIMPGLVPLMRWGGAAFLAAYGALSFRNAWRGGESLEASGNGTRSLRQVLLTVLALTWLNPHVYLDTVILLGTVSTRFPGAELAFALGAMTGSFAFFFALGYGARWLRPLFARPVSWRVLDGLIALTMWAIAVSLLRGG